MLVAGLAILSVIWGLWLTYMVRYPREWGNQVDRIHSGLEPYGLSFPWMAKVEKGFALKLIVGATTVAILMSLLIVLRHPQALSTFLCTLIISRVEPVHRAANRKSCSFHRLVEKWPNRRRYEAEWPAPQ